MIIFDILLRYGRYQYRRVLIVTRWENVDKKIECCRIMPLGLIFRAVVDLLLICISIVVIVFIGLGL